jgi:4-amino-4-deoxy-L-arabinose transferase-like glycosyltransferase
LAPPGRTEVRRDVCVIAAGAAALFLVALGARDLWSPNEPTYGQAVAEMAARRAWLVPTVNGAAFGEKPILYFWLARVAAWLSGGVTEAALRLPSAIAAVAGTSLVYFLVHPYAGRWRARWAAALFATQYLVWWTARSVQMDLILAVSTLAAVAAAARTVDGRSPPLAGWSWAGAAAGVGCVAKGPVGLIGPVLVIVAYLALTRRLRLLAGWAPALGLAVAALVAAPWYVALALWGETEVLREVLFRQNVVRFFDPWDHERPWWYYLKHVWIDFAPWSWFAPIAAALPGRDDGERRIDRLAWVWLVVLLLFFSLSASKRSPYLLPAAPAVAILAASALESFVRQRTSWQRSMLVWLVLATGAAAAVAVGAWIVVRLVPLHPDLASEGHAVGALCVAGGAVVLAATARRSRMGAVAGWLALLVSTYVFAAVVLLPAVNPRKSARTFCERVNALVPAQVELASFRFWAFRGAYAFYSGRAIENLTTTEALRQRWEAPAPAWIIVEEHRLEEARAVVGEGAPLVRAAIGGGAAYLFWNGR